MQLNPKLTKRTLETKFVQFANPLDWSDSIAVSASADLADATRQIVKLEMASRSLSRNASLARDLRAAIACVDDGTYGIRVDCEEPITPRCLAAVPLAARCRNCKESIENAGELDDALAV